MYCSSCVRRKFCWKITDSCVWQEGDGAATGEVEEPGSEANHRPRGRVGLGRETGTGEIGTETEGGTGTGKETEIEIERGGASPGPALAAPSHVPGNEVQTILLAGH